MSLEEITKTEQEMWALARKLEKLRKDSKPVLIKNYRFETLTGSQNLLDFFGKRDKLIAIHNMGQGCRWCTSWADGINAHLASIESEFSLVLFSKDNPETQRQFALSRDWKFRMASHGGGDYIREQSVQTGKDNMPGIVCYERQGEKIFRKNASIFGPGDSFNSLFHIMSLGGIGMEQFTPQFSYWKRPQILEDGGKNLNIS